MSINEFLVGEGRNHVRLSEFRQSLMAETQAKKETGKKMASKAGSKASGKSAAGKNAGSKGAASKGAAAKKGARPGNLRSRQKEQREADILQAAIRVMAHRGYHQTRISDIAQEAGVAYGLVYHYFGSKEKILGAILDTIWERFGARIERIRSGDAATVDKLSDISDYMLDTAIARPDIIQLLVREVVHANHLDNVTELKVVRHIIGMIESVFNDGIGRGELSPNADARMLALTFFGSVEMMLTALSQGLYDSESTMDSRKIRHVKKKMRIFIRGGSFGRI